MRSCCFSTIPIHSWITKSVSRSRTSATFSLFPAFKRLNTRPRYVPVGSQQVVLAYGTFYTAWAHLCESDTFAAMKDTEVIC